MARIPEGVPQKTPVSQYEAGDEGCFQRIQEGPCCFQSERRPQKKKVSKKVTFDDLEGGAIRNPDYRSAAPAREDFTTVMRGAEISQFEGNRTAYFSTALDMIPKNLYPMSQYDSLLQGSNPAYMKDVLKQGLSGYGAHRDPVHIQQAVVHSLKKYPKLLHAYLNSRNLI